MNLMYKLEKPVVKNAGGIFLFAYPAVADVSQRLELPAVRIFPLNLLFPVTKKSPDERQTISVSTSPVPRSQQWHE